MYFGKKQITAFATFKNESKIEEDLHVEVVKNGEYSIDAPAGTVYKKVSASVNVPVPEQQELSVDVAENGEFVNTAPDGTAYNKVTVNVNVPSKEEQSKSVELDFAAGDMAVTPDSGKVLSVVNIAKPATLISENIAEGVEIAGVVGTHVGGGGAAADVRYVTFMNGSEVLYVKPVAVGDDCADIIARGLIDAPTKASTAQYNYTHYGWGAADNGAADSTILQNITEDKTVYAIYTATVRAYTITWMDDDGATVLKTEQVAYGAVPSYTPTKEGVSFDKWTPTPTKVTGDASYTASWSQTLASGQLGTTANWTLTTNGVLTISGTGAIPSYTNIWGTNPPPWYSSYASDITSIVVSEGITHIGNHAFTQLQKATSISLPSTLKHIGENAFNGSGVQSIEVPDGVTLGASAFSGTNLISVTLPSTLTDIPSYTFWKAVFLKNVVIPAGVKSIGTEAFLQTGLESINIPAMVTSIGKSAFYNAKSLTSATFENPNGWTAGTTALSATDLANPETAATYLVTTHRSSAWTRS